MMKLKLLFIVVSATFFLWVLAIAVTAQEELPPAYAGLRNPFSWSDTSAQEAGGRLYQQYCIGCHGANGSNIVGADFSAADFPQRLEEKPDVYFWILSEGRLDKGMPPFKSSLSEQQRWQALTYLWSIGKIVSPEVAPPQIEPPAEIENGALLLNAPEQAQPGQPLSLSATVRDKDGKPIQDVAVKFFIRVEFFTNGLMEIGDVLTNDQGVAIFEYTPRQTGTITVVARYEDIETTTTISLAESAEPFYQAEAGLPESAPIPEVFVGPKSALDPGEGGAAPTTGLRIPGGLPSLFLLVYVFTVILVWSLYLRVMYQVFGISSVKEMGDTNTRLIPLIGMAVMVAFATLLVLILITGPYSNPHLLR